MIEQLAEDVLFFGELRSKCIDPSTRPHPASRTRGIAQDDKVERWSSIRKPEDSPTFFKSLSATCSSEISIGVPVNHELTRNTP